MLSIYIILVHNKRLQHLLHMLHACAIITDAGTVTIEAMCSSYSAGLKWTVNETRRDAYIVSVVDFRCAKINGVLSSRSVSLYIEMYCAIQLDCIVTLYIV